MYRNVSVSRCGAAFAVALFCIVPGIVPLSASAQTPTVVASVDSSTLSESAGRGNVRLTLVNPPASDLESGTNLDGALGDGMGKWRLRVEADEPIVVMSLLQSPTGHLTDLSTAPGRRASAPPR